MTQILTHRGLDPSREDYFMESSKEAFLDQLNRGFGLEFDFQITRDREIIIFHDKTLARISEWFGEKKISDLWSSDILEREYFGCHIISLSSLLSEIERRTATCAIHWKGSLQTQRADIDLILECLMSFSLSNIMLFDLKPETAKYIQSKLSIAMAPSVAHTYDRKRFNDYVDGTLISIEEALVNRDIYQWLWLDEWDLLDEKNGDKVLYCKEIFQKARERDYKIAIVSPELHAMSPALLGGESHPDAENSERLELKMMEILELSPDLVCTDYPDRVKSMLRI
jgi:hypothetical protein